MSEARAREMHWRGLRELRDGKLQIAERSFREALSEWDQAVPQQHAWRAYTIHDLGRCLIRADKTDEAQYLLRKSLDIKRTVCPNDKASIAATISGLGSCLLSQGKLYDAEKLLRESLDMQKSACPDNKANVAITIGELGSCLLNQGQLDDSEKLLRESLDMIRFARPDDKRTISIGIHELGRCLLDNGKPDEAENLLRESLGIKQTAYPDDKASIAITIRELGRCLMNKGKSVEAEKILRQSLDMKRTACPDKKNSIAITIRELGHCLMNMGNTDESENLLRNSRDMLGAAYPDDKVNIAKTTHILGACLLKKGETDEAEDLLRKALDMKRTACPDAKASIYATIFILAKCLMSEGKTDEAVTLLRESMDIEKSVYPDNQACIAINSPPGLSKYEEEIYERAMNDGHVEVERTNIKVMGRDRVGKTCFADSLADKRFCREQMSTDTVTVRTMITSTKSFNAWTEVLESDTALYLDEAMAKGILLHQQRLFADETSVVASTTSSGLSASQPMEDVNDSKGILSKFSSRLQTLFNTKREHSSNSVVPQAQSQSELPASEGLSRPSETELPFSAQSADDMIRIAAASLPDEAVLYSLVDKLRSDPELMQQETSLRVVKVWDFPGQPLFWSMLAGLLPNEPSPYTLTVCMLVFKMSRLLSDCAQMPVFVDYQHGPLSQPLHWIEREGDFIRYLLIAIRISQTDPPEGSQVVEVEEVLSPAVFAVATHADEAEENEKEQNEVFTQLLEDSGYDAHVVLPSKDNDVKFFKVDNTKSGSGTGDENVREICSRVERMSNAFFKKRGKRLVPLRFLRLEKLIYRVELVLGRGLVKVEMLRQLAKRLCYILDEEFVVALKSLTNFAVLFYFPDVVQLSELVVISPKWLFNAMAAFASVEKRDQLQFVQPDWRKLKKSGIMSWQLAEYLLKSRGVQEDEYGGVLQLFRLIGIICPRTENPSDMTSPIAAGTELFVPSLMEESAVSNESVGVVDRSSPNLPPSLVFCPKNVDMFPEVLFFRFITFLLSKFTISPHLKRYEAVFRLHHDLLLKVVYHPCRYVTATISSLNEIVVQSTIAPYCSQLFQVMSEELHKAKHPGMAGFQLDLCIHLPTDSDGPTSRIDTTKLVPVNDYTPHSPLARRDHSPVSSLECPSLSMWFTPSSSQLIERHSAKSILRAVLKHGASRWYAIGIELGYSDDEVRTKTCHTSDYADKLLAIVEAKSNLIGEGKTLEEVLTACKNIVNPIIGAVEDELNTV